MADADYLVLLYDAAGTTILADPIGPAPYEYRVLPGQVARFPFYLGNVAGWRTIDLSPRDSEAGSGEVSCNATDALLAVVDIPEIRVAVVREAPGEEPYIEMAGPLEVWKLTRQAERDGTDGLGVLTLNFTDDLASLATRLVYPDPALASTAQTTTTKYVITTTNAEDAARALVLANAGASALAPRIFPEMVLDADAGVGTSVSASFTRSVTLTDALRYVLFLGGGLGMRTYQSMTTGQAMFEVFARRDLSDSVWFSWDLGNVRSMEYEKSAPVATVAIVGDATAGTARVVKERSNAAALAAGWRRKEMFVDGRSAQNATELEQLGDKALDDSGPGERVSVQAIETPQQMYRKHFRIGDYVSVEVFPGRVIQEIVRGVDIKVTAEAGEDITPLIGTTADIDLKASALERMRKELKQLSDAVGITI